MKIVLAIDGSACSDAAVDEVVRRCWPADSQVRVISVIEPPAPLTSGPWTYANAYEEQEALERAQAEETLCAAATKLREGKVSNTLNITTEVLVGSPKRIIVEEAALGPQEQLELRKECGRAHPHLSRGQTPGHILSAHRS